MAARGSTGSQRRRAEAERARLYAARSGWRTRQIRRRTRDNVIAAAGTTVLLIGIVVSQVVHAQVTDPMQSPAPMSTPAPTNSAPVSPAPTETPTP